MPGTNTKLRASRQEIYGDYPGGVELRSYIMDAIEIRHSTVNGKEMNQIDKEYIWDIVNKLTRIAVTPNHTDSWRDISNYAEMTAIQLEIENALQSESETP